MQVPVLQPGSSTSTLLPMVLFQNVSEGPPNSVLQVAVKNNQQPVWYFTDKIPLQALFVEDGRMERGAFLEVIPVHLHFVGVVQMSIWVIVQHEVYCTAISCSVFLLHSKGVSYVGTSLLYQTWKALPDSHEVAKELPNALITSVEITLEKLATTNLFFIAKRALKDTNQEVLYSNASLLLLKCH